MKLFFSFKKQQINILFLSLIITVLTIDSLSGQKIQKYRSLINNAEIAVAEKKYSSAVSFYKKAFKTKKEYNFYNFLVAATCAKEAGQHKKMMKFLLKAVDTGCTLELIKTKDYLKDGDKFTKSLEDQYPKRRKKFLASIDLDIFLELERMEVLDQTVRTEEIFFDSIGMITWTKVDSVNMEKLISLTKKYGWLGPDKVGHKGSINAFIILLHGSVDEIEDKAQIAFFESYLLRAIKNGTENPLRYSTLIDRYRIWVESKGQLYGTFNTNEGFDLIDNIENVDERRRKIGLESLKDYAIKKGFKLPKGYIEKS